MSIRPSIEPGDDYLNKVIKYIPAEITAFYVFAAGLISSSEADPYYLFRFTLITLLIITPLWIYLSVNNPQNPANRKQRIFHSAVAEIAMLIWIYNISMEWLVRFFSNNLPNDPVAGSLVLAIFTLIVPILEKVFIK
jgi:hypothetical protein